MTKKDVHEAIKVIAEMYGFKTEDDNWGFRIVDETKAVNFTITEDVNGDWENQTAEITIKVAASIATMGGAPTPDELIKIGKRIVKAGELVNKMALYQEWFKSFTYIETWK